MELIYGTDHVVTKSVTPSCLIEKIMEIDDLTLLNALLENHNSIILAIDLNYRYYIFNSKHAALMKAMYGAAIRKSDNMLQYITVEEDRQYLKEKFDKAFRGESMISVKWFGNEKSIKSIFEMYTYPLRRGNEVFGATMVVSDIAEIEELRNINLIQRSRQASFAQMVPDFVLLCRADGVRLFANTSYCDFFGKTEDQILDVNNRTEEDMFRFQKVIRKLSPETPTHSAVELLENNAGRKQWTQWNQTGVFDSTGKLVEVLSMGRNIDEIIRAEKANEEYIHVLEQAIFKTTHELRQPVVNIIALSELLKNNKISVEELTQVVSFLRSSADNLDVYSRSLTEYIHYNIQRYRSINRSIVTNAGEED